MRFGLPAEKMVFHYYMQTQDASAEEILFKLWPWLEANKNRILAIAGVILIVFGTYFFITSRHEQREVDAGQAFTDRLLAASGPVGGSADQFTKVAQDYDGTEAGKRATLQSASMLFDAGKFADAQAQFQKFLAGTSSGPLAATAQLGLAQCLAALGKNDDALAAFKHTLAAYPDTAAAYMAELTAGRLEEAQGKFTDAANDYQDLARNRVAGPLAQTAYDHLQTLQSRLPAAPAPKSTVAPATTPAATATQSTTPTLLLPAK